MEKINVAELLCNCPSGMTLDCTMYEDVCFDYVDELNIIHCYIQRKTHKTSLTFNQHGTPNSDIKSKCVIFPIGKTTWEGFVPPCEFKDGDIISASYCDVICIFKDEGNIKGTVDFYCGISGNSDELLIKDVKNQDEHFGDIDEYKLATKEEKEKLFKVIKYNGYVWNEETKSLEKLPKIKVNDRVKKKSIDDVDAVKIAKIIQSIHTFTNKFDITTLKPFESKVLVRDTNTDKWRGAFYSHYKSKKFYIIGGSYYYQCIPYEGNEYLLDTTNDCDNYYKNW